MAKPKLIIEIDEKTTEQEVMEIIDEYLNGKLNAEGTYTRNEIDTMFLTHNHDDNYASLEQVNLLVETINDNDYGGLFDDILLEGEIEDEAGSI